jgi:hypothetical protein
MKVCCFAVCRRVPDKYGCAARKEVEEQCSEQPSDLPTAQMDRR